MEKRDRLCEFVIGNLLMAWLVRYVENALDYYGVPIEAEELRSNALQQALHAAILIPREEVVAWGASS